MDDLISRQAAIDAMANTLWHYPNECYRNLNEYEFAKGLAELGLKSVPSAQPEQRWIPCSERLPEEKMNPNTSDFELVICTTTFGDVRAYRFGTPIGWNEPHFWNGIGIMDGYVLAWMPLPEPYKTESEDKE